MAYLPYVLGHEYVMSEIGIPTPVDRLILMDEIVRPATGPFAARSLPGHQVDFVLSGEVREVAEGRTEHLGKGAVSWYYESEPLRGEVLQAPWRFITVNFLAPSLAPPPDDQRVMRCAPAALARARELLELWRNRTLAPMERELRCHILLFYLLLDVLPRECLHRAPPAEMKIWWSIEKKLRARLEEAISLKSIKALTNCSVRTVERACKAATGLPPMKRLKELRLGHAHGLVRYSNLAITEIAFRVGYSRSQEFSRDYRRKYGLSPREHRRQAAHLGTFEMPQAQSLPWPQ